MCMLCDGSSIEEIEQRSDLIIQVYGFLLQQVESDRPWTYTVGMFESWGQPDLVMTEAPLAVQRKVVAALASDCESGGTISAELVAALDVELVPVHPCHFVGGLVAMWEHRYSMAAGVGDFKRVVLGASWFTVE